MDDLQAELVRQEARRERFRYRLAAGLVVGVPLLAAMITVSLATTLKRTRFLTTNEMFVMIAVGNAMLAAVGSGFGVWIEPGNHPRSKIAGLLGGCLFGFLVYFALSAVALTFVDLFRR